MNNDDLIKVWDDSQQNKSITNQKITKEMIENYLKPKLSKDYLSFNISILVTLVAFVASIIVFSINVYVYRNNPAMFRIELIGLISSLLFLCYGVYVFIRLRDINNFSKNLIDLIQSKLTFVKNQYEVWLVILSVGMVFLVFGINTLIDNVNGTYQINNLTSYAMVNLFVLGFVYIINKFSTHMAVKKMKLYLSDLQSGILENSVKAEAEEKRRIWMFILFSVIVTAFIVFGIFKLLRVI